MLQKVLDEVKRTPGVINLDELGKKLGIAPGSLEGMLGFLIQRGYLADNIDPTETPTCETGKTCSNGHACPGPAECPFMIQMPRVFSLSVGGEQNKDNSPE